MLIYVFSPSRVALAVTIVSRVSLICADILLVYITWSTLVRRQSARILQAGADGLSFADVLLRNGKPCPYTPCRPVLPSWTQGCFTSCAFIACFRCTFLKDPSPSSALCILNSLHLAMSTLSVSIVKSYSYEHTYLPYGASHVRPLRSPMPQMSQASRSREFSALIRPCLAHTRY